MTSINTLRHPNDPHEQHVSVSVFIGPDREHRALAGVLVFRRGEDDEFIHRVEDQYQVSTENFLGALDAAVDDLVRGTGYHSGKDIAYYWPVIREAIQKRLKEGS